MALRAQPRWLPDRGRVGALRRARATGAVREWAERTRRQLAAREPASYLPRARRISAASCRRIAGVALRPWCGGAATRPVVGDARQPLLARRTRRARAHLGTSRARPHR